MQKKHFKRIGHKTKFTLQRKTRLIVNAFDTSITTENSVIAFITQDNNARCNSIYGSSDDSKVANIDCTTLQIAQKIFSLLIGSAKVGLLVDSGSVLNDALAGKTLQNSPLALWLTMKFTKALKDFRKPAHQYDRNDKISNRKKVCMLRMPSL